MEDISVSKAMNVLKNAMQEDYGYAWSWQCNLAVMMQDVGVPHKVANEGAARFMKLAFDIDTSKAPIGASSSTEVEEAI